MIFLYILLAIVAFFVIILSIRVRLIAEYDEKIYFTVKYLFLTFKLLPFGEKKKKKKTEKPQKAKEQPKTENPPEKPQKRNIFKDFYDLHGVAGVIELLKETARIMSGYFKSIFKHFIINDLFLDMKIAGYDAADTALRYGKVSAVVFSALGKICSSANVKKYNADVSPDFLAEESTVQFYVNCSFRPIFIVNASIVLLFKMFFKVIMKLIKAKPDEAKVDDVKEVTTSAPEQV